MTDPLRPNRRELLKGAAALGLASATGCLPKGPLSEPISDPGAGTRPNMIVMITDDQAASAWGGAPDYPFLSTPNLERLAAEGAELSQAFCTTALCSPSRASLLTGCYAHRHGVIHNEENDLPPEMPTYPRLLQQSGYQTAFIGKWHMRHGAEVRPGFDHWVAFDGQGDYIDPKLNVDGEMHTATGYVTDVLTDYAVDWLRAPRTAPFCLVLSHKAAHQPFVPAAHHAQAFADATLPKPGNFDDDYASKPAWLRRATL